MTGSTEFLTNLQKEYGGQVTFGDGVKGSVVGKGDLNVQGLPKLKNVLLVDRLKANLISISQLCDQNLHVKFTKDGCQVIDDKHISILEGTRTDDNCYKLLLSHQCQYTIENTSQLWHKRLGHIHARGLHKLVKYGAVRGLPTLKGTVETVCKGYIEVSYTETQESASDKEIAPSIRVQKNHPADAIIGNVNEGMNIRGKKKNSRDMVKFVRHTSLVEPRKVEEALKDELWIRVM
ncbi:hypothetical protein H6P81_018055 [Aristolochia fimbriata]|uniref:GAG-pre-integrase domain-containing protein n=1 Tax=Aristolochia fimbriata TaxID=158543 RepID=A0AAV7E334_ARIFI|nr:hypothetical protein H6P81_018055 [Aristolochia fimbriata]